MPLQSVSTGEVFTVRVYKVFNQYRFANTYEIVAQSSETNTGETFWNTVAGKFANLESQLVFPFIQVDRVVISSYVPDGSPYNPTSFISLPFNIFGTRGISGDIAPANLCLVVRKNVTYGRDGRNFYRGNLLESDVVGGFPEASLSTSQKNFLQNLFSNWHTDFINDTIFRLCLASGTPNPTNVRIVTNLVVEGRIASKKINNRYFKRNPGVPTP
jgi:hypothetical protein